MQKKLDCWRLSQYLPRRDYTVTNTVTIKDVLKTSDDSDVGYAVHVNIKNHDHCKKLTKFFPFLTRTKIVEEILFRSFLKNVEFKNYKPQRKLIFGLE